VDYSRLGKMYKNYKKQWHSKRFNKNYLYLS
jgi:hypothetical protein